MAFLKRYVHYYRILTIICCVCGVLAVAYGMTFKNHSVFVLGILAVIAGYLLIRGKLKAEMKKS